MFFPEKIKSITKNDQVLEIGPGNTPYFRSNVLLEKIFKDERTTQLQAGGTEKKKLNKKIVYYDVDEFPFEDGEFDYVICSHVLEHIPVEQFSFFINELMRVAPRGYIEVPLYSYEMLTNIEHHLSYLSIDSNNKIFYKKKNPNDFDGFIYQEVIHLLETSKIKNKIINLNLDKLVYGFEWRETIDYERVDDMKILTAKMSLDFRGIRIHFLRKIMNKLKTLTNSNRLKQMIYQRFVL